MACPSSLDTRLRDAPATPTARDPEQAERAARAGSTAGNSLRHQLNRQHPTSPFTPSSLYLQRSPHLACSNGAKALQRTLHITAPWAAPTALPPATRMEPAPRGAGLRGMGKDKEWGSSASMPWALPSSACSSTPTPPSRASLPLRRCGTRLGTGAQNPHLRVNRSQQASGNQRVWEASKTTRLSPASPSLPGGTHSHPDPKGGISLEGDPGGHTHGAGKGSPCCCEVGQWGRQLLLLMIK